jgi:hypothetical protein
MPTKRLSNTLSLVNQWAHANVREWRMYRDASRNELRAAVAWEFARERLDLFGPLAEKRDFFSDLDARIDELLVMAANGRLRSKERRELDILREERRKVRPSLLEFPLSRIWGSLHFPQPWLDLPQQERSELVTAFSPESVARLHVVRPEDSRTDEFFEHAEEKRRQLRGSPHCESPWGALSGDDAEAVYFTETDGRGEILVLLRVERSGDNSAKAKTLLELLDRIQPGTKIAVLPTGPMEKRAKALLLGLALDRLKKNTSGSWAQIEAAIVDVTKERPFTGKVRETKQGSTYFPHYRRSQKAAQDFRERLLEPSERHFLLPN